MQRKITTTMFNDAPIFGSALMQAAHGHARDDDEKFLLCATLMAHELRDYARLANIDAALTPDDVAGSMTFNAAYNTARDSGFDASEMVDYNSRTRQNIKSLRSGVEPSECTYLAIINELQVANVGFGRKLQVGLPRVDPHFTR